jgi:DNA repair exonuclease SbcCD ATPase subunit
METSNNNNLKTIIVILIILLVGSLAYLFKVSSDKSTLEETVVNVEAEKDTFFTELQALKIQYDAAIETQTSLTGELEAERAKVIALIAEAEKYKGDSAALQRLKNQYKTLESRMKELVAENQRLIEANKQLTEVIDSTNTVLSNEKEYTKKLANQNEELAKTVEKGSKLSILNLQTSAYKVRSSGKEIATDKARRADMLKISFTIAENNIAKSGDRKYYVQVIDANSNVLGERQTVEFNGKPLTYSFVSTVKFQNSTVNVVENLTSKNFDKGVYFINVYYEGERIANSEFNLR